MAALRLPKNNCECEEAAFSKKTVPRITPYRVDLTKYEGWRDSVLGAPRRLLVSLGSFSRTASPCPAKEDLPKLPVPDLESTMQKYLAQVEVIAPKCWEKTQSIVKSFLAGPGPKLQQRLLDRREQTINWATDFWLKDMYLSVPLPLPINSNPGLVLQPKKFSNQREAACFLARFLNGLFDYQELADRDELPVERLRSTDGKPGQPLCMVQHYKLFSKYRRPGKELDEQLILDRTSSGNHVIVVNHNQFYSVPVRASDRGRLTEAELTQQILKIMEIPADPRTPPVGVLTAARRPVWAAAREELAKNDTNRHNLELLERCLCIICLDDDVLPTTFNDSIGKKREVGHWIGDRDETNLFHHALHGGGSRHLGANRWYDKTLQFFLGKDGAWGVNYEHSAAEAPAVFGIIENIESQIAAMPPSDENTIPSHLPAPEKLEWRLSEQSLNDIRDAMTSFDAMVEDLDLCVFHFTEYNKDFIKSCKVSPDVYIQLVLQLTYFRLHGSSVATYESAGLRRFALGRVDCIRSASVEALAWAKAMCQGDPGDQPPLSAMQQEEGAKRVQFTIYSDQKIRQLFELAVKRQTKEMNDNVSGQGIDNHLLGLRESAKEAGDPIPELFTDEAYRRINRFALSTSQITTLDDVMAGYGPVVPEGYGCAYNFRKNGVLFYISAFHSDGSTSTSRFAKALESSLRATAAMLQDSPK
ncbi:choline O-acetyltransferase isoform X1 [Diprion similis]|uniref:choline O-acetyltransferase isoform X1 n=1 Tax=Diprion similis TaxID=362088 RepID=UPI001EF856B5|nr:choline O-acetyltransferase isoform X1 [Diprion similis]